MHLHHAQHRLAVRLVAGERTDRRGHFGAGQVGRAVQQRRDRTAEAAAGVRVVGQAVGHEQAAEVGVAQAQRAEQMAVASDLAASDSWRDRPGFPGR